MALIRARSVETGAASSTTREFRFLIFLTFVNILARLGVRLAQVVAVGTGALDSALEIEALMRTSTVFFGALVDILASETIKSVEYNKSNKLFFFTFAGLFVGP